MVAIEQPLLPEEREPPPVSADAIPPAARRVGASPRQVFALTAIGTVFLALFASRDLPSWSERLADLPFGPAMQRAAAEWDEAMAALGLTRPHQILRRTMRNLLDQQWGGRE